MTWMVCTCGHPRAKHHENDYVPGGYGGCGICQVCGKTSYEHVFVEHVFQACPCAGYGEETA